MRENMTEIKKGKVIVFSAASGAGKTTILDRLREEMPELVYSISATTRPPREGEIDGTHYFFLSVDDFKRKIEEDAFAEWAEVHNNFYGTPKEFIDNTVNSGKTIIMDIDVYGKITFDKAYPKAVGVFILPPSMEILEKRLRGRGTDSDEVIATRLKNAVEENSFSEEKGKYEYKIVNDDLEVAVKETVQLVQKIIES